MDLLLISIVLVNFAIFSFDTIYTVVVTNPHSMGGFDLKSEGVSTVQSATAPYQLLVSTFCI